MKKENKLDRKNFLHISNCRILMESKKVQADHGKIDRMCPKLFGRNESQYY